EDRGWIASFWGTSENNRRARYYRLTPKGRTQLSAQTSRWDAVVRAVNRVLRPADWADADGLVPLPSTRALGRRARPRVGGVPRNRDRRERREGHDAGGRATGGTPQAGKPDTHPRGDLRDEFPPVR